MGQVHSQFHCNRCGRVTLHVGDVYSPPHMLHGLLTFFCCGLWAPIWVLHTVLDAMFRKVDYRCTLCGQSPYERIEAARTAVIVDSAWQAEIERERQAVRAEQARLAFERKAVAEVVWRARVDALNAAMVSAARRVDGWFLAAAEGERGPLYWFIWCLVAAAIVLGIVCAGFGIGHLVA